MNERQLEQLIRMVADVESLEYDSAAPPRRLDPPARVVRIGRIGVGGPVSRVAAVLAAAACLMYLVWPWKASDDGLRHVPLHVRYVPATATSSGESIAHFQSTAGEPCVLLAVYRTWESACECLSWQIHEWDGGVMTASAGPNRSVSFPLDVSDDPPVEQVVVVAAARRARDLPGTCEQAEALLACLNEIPVPEGAEVDPALVASTVRACLPVEVTLVSRSFVVDGR
ncbi:MAG: hypothetical protein CHACPFDD_01669 [Phycisphaerae bacterium]|nr:hypothetical protein [Phycisphaerae bacterium]